MTTGASLPSRMQDPRSDGVLKRNAAPKRPLSRYATNAPNLRWPKTANATPAKPSAIMVQVEDSGTPDPPEVTNVRVAEYHDAPKSGS